MNVRRHTPTLPSVPARTRHQVPDGSCRMGGRFPRSSLGLRLRAVISLLSLALLATNAFAWAVNNQTSVALRAKVVEGNWDVEIPAGQERACHWSDTGCNPSGNQNAQVTLQVETLDGDSRKLNLVVTMVAGGSALIYEEARPIEWSMPGSMGVLTRGLNGEVFSQSPLNVLGVTSRHVHFLISADCQYCRDGDCGDDGNALAFVATGLNRHMTSRLTSDSTIRGICYAGDLTQFTHGDELETYLDSIKGFTRFVFDGLGNHDLHNGRTAVWESVRDRKRITARTQDSDPHPHYSWDWHDVHFVQLNLMPANEKAPNTPHLNNDNHDPMEALTFLIADLALHVGNSGRPVMLIHHYGFDDFSIARGGNLEEWWTAAQRLAYWNAIASYNVAAIFTGHLHIGPNVTSSAKRFISWTRPDGAAGGPPSIPTFVSGAARDDAYLDVEFNNANQLRVQVRNRTGGVTGSRCYIRPTPIWVAPTTSLVGRGWKNDPYTSFLPAMNAAALRINDAACPDEPVADIRVKPGSYAGGVRLATPARLTLDGVGTARVGP